MASTFSIIIPTLNEERLLPACLERLRDLPPGSEILVADGGSQDRTLAIAADHGARVCHAPRGRGPQCNTAAAQAQGSILLFLYADTVLPANAFEIVQTWFAQEYVCIATFRLQFDVAHWLLDPAPVVTQFDTVFTRFGDQGIVVRRWFFEAIGGFPDWPLFEDVRLLEKARFRTIVHSLPATVISSARKYQRDGVLNNHLANVWLILQYLAGVSPHELAKQYWKG
jgi:rSAM/selenodomain-associated transferase 2